MSGLTRPPYRHRLHRRVLVERLALHLVLSLALLLGSLGVGMWGYSHYENMQWRDAFVNSAMILGGMGPVKQDLSEDGKIFAGIYALYSGLMFIVVTGLLLAPGVHHIMKRVHWEDHGGTD